MLAVLDCRMKPSGNTQHEAGSHQEPTHGGRPIY